MRISKICFICSIITVSLSAYSNSEIDSLLDDAKQAFVENKNVYGLFLIDEAGKIAERNKDYKSCQNIGEMCSNLPVESKRNERAKIILKKGADFALAEGRWYILGDIAKVLQKLGDKEGAISIYDEIFLEVKELKDKEAFITLKAKYAELGDPGRAQLCSRMIKALTISPPPGWRPLGETVRGPKKPPSEEVQSAQRQIEDMQVQKAIEYDTEKEKLKEKKKERRIY
jgi:tetratricopeptide (TPR) repeat protein